MTKCKYCGFEVFKRYYIGKLQIVEKAERHGEFYIPHSCRVKK